MKEKKVKCRKAHECCMCEEEIKPGEYAILHEDRRPKFIEINDTTEKQTGIEYLRYYKHVDHGEEDCPECNHRGSFKLEYTHNGNEYWKCNNCGYDITFP